MGIFYSAGTRGFYDSEIHGDNIPTDAVEITEELRTSLIAAQGLGKVIEPDDKGHPVSRDQAPPTTERLASNARAQRDDLLSACDWTQLADAALTAEKKNAWQAYRQALRDVPSQSGFPSTITWPTSP